MKPEHLDLIAGEPDLRVFLHVEEIGAAQMRVAIGVSRPKIPRVDCRRNGSLLGVLRIVVEAPVDVFEVSPDVGDHHMADAKLGRCVPRLEEPFHWAGLTIFFVNWASGSGLEPAWTLTQKRLPPTLPRLIIQPLTRRGLHQKGRNTWP